MEGDGLLGKRRDGLIGRIDWMVEEGRVSPSRGDGTLARSVSARLIRGILEGRYPPGSRMPNEREISKSFGVNRNVVREALRSLEAMGLVRIRRGSGTYVQDLRISGGVNLVPFLLVREDGTLNLEVLRDILEFFQNNVVETVRLAARRMDPETLGQLSELLDRAESAEGGEREGALRDFARTVVASARNVFYLLLYNTMLNIPLLSTAFFNVMVELFPSILPYLRRMLEAFQGNDERMAVLLVRNVFRDLGKEIGASLVRLYFQVGREGLRGFLLG